MAGCCEKGAAWGPRPRCVAQVSHSLLWASVSPPVQREEAGGLSGPLHFALPHQRQPPFWGVYQLPLVDTPVVLGLDQGFPSSRMLSVLQVGKLLWG